MRRVLLAAALTGLATLACAKTGAPADEPQEHCWTANGRALVCEQARAELAKPRPADTSTPIDIAGLPALPAPAPGTKVPEEARARVSAARALMKDPDGPRWLDAHQELMEAYRQYPSPKLLALIAECAEHVDRPGEAMDAYQLLLQDQELEADKRRELEARLATLKDSTATIVVRGLALDARLDDRRVLPSGETVNREYFALSTSAIVRVPAGRHVFRAALHYADPWEIELVSGTTAEHVFDPKLPPDCQ